MKTTKTVLAVLALGVAQTMFAANETVPLKAGWKFFRGDDPNGPDNMTLGNMSRVIDEVNRTGTWMQRMSFSYDFARPDFDDSSWRDVRVPHDWAIEKSFDASRAYGDAYLDIAGTGWYRRELIVGPKGEGPFKDLGNRVVYFECDGAMSYPMLFVNGKFAGGWAYGYIRWRADITKHLKPGRNVLAIRCHNMRDASRWYTGGGLYRNCRYLVCPADHVRPGSVRISSRVSGGTLAAPESAEVTVSYEMSKSGRRERAFTIKKPRLWDVNDPHLYTVDVEGNRYRHGVRTAQFRKDGFYLNGRRVPINGVSMHHEFGVLGAAWNRGAQRRRLVKFKEAGVNAIRSSHNPPDEGLLELCDELGLLFKDEVFDEWLIGTRDKRSNGYSGLFALWSERDVRAWVRTDRNHPCIILYSIGNEIVDGYPEWGRTTEEFIADALRLRRFVRDEDPTRPVTNSNNNDVNMTNQFAEVLDVLGCNYYQWQYENIRHLHPNQPFFASESQCMSLTRGEFIFPVKVGWTKKEDRPNGVNSSYCWEAGHWSRPDGGWASPPDVIWHYMDKVPDCAGEFVWTGIDYLGGPYWIPEFGVPIHTCNTGFLDLAGFRKDSFYLYQSRWLPEKPMAHILPHWNWPERVGKVTPVYVFTSGDEGELFLNGRSLGRQRKQPGVFDRAYRLRWDGVVYEPGRLEVVVYRKGREWARDVVETVGEPAALRIEVENPKLVSDGEDVAFVNVAVVDAKGRTVPRAANEVEFSVEGPGRLIATDNGDERDFTDFHLAKRRTLSGLVQGLVRANAGSSGSVTVRVRGEGLVPGEAKIDVVNSNEEMQND